MISHFRKGQQIRANDLNDITNAITGRMIGGVGINVRKMAGGAVIDADVKSFSTHVSAGNILKINASTLAITRTKRYEITGNRTFNVNIQGENIIFGTTGNPVSIINKADLSTVDYYNIPDRDSYNFIDTVTDYNNIYVGYYESLFDSTIYIDKYDYSFNLVASGSFSQVTNLSSVVAINNDANYILLSRGILNKSLSTTATLNRDLGSANSREVFLDNDFIYIASDDSNEIRKHSASNGAFQNSFDDDGNANVTRNAVAVDEENVYWAGAPSLVSSSYGGIFKLDHSLNIIDSIASYSGKSLFALIMCLDQNYLYVLHQDAIGPISTTYLAKYRKSDMSFIKRIQLSYVGRFPGSSYTFFPRGMQIDNGNIYIVGTGEGNT